MGSSSLHAFSPAVEPGSLDRVPIETADFGYGGLRIRVRTDRGSDLGWLSEFLVPAFELLPDGGLETPTVEVRLLTDPDAFHALRSAGPEGACTTLFALDTRLASAAYWIGADTWTVAFDADAHVFYLRSPDRSVFVVLADHGRPSVRGTVMRAVRELAMNALQGDSLLLHAAAVDVEGGLVIAGPKRAGKTTTLAALLGHDNGVYVSNDRVVLEVDDDEVRMTGMPTYASVRDGTLNLMPDAYDELHRTGFHARLTVAEALGRREPARAMDDGRYSLSPAQLRHLFDAPALGRTRAAAIVMLAPLADESTETRGPALTPLDPETAAGHVASARLGASYGSERSRFFLPPDAATRPSTHPDHGICERIVSSVPCFEWTAMRGRPGVGLVDELRAAGALAAKRHPVS